MHRTPTVQVVLLVTITAAGFASVLAGGAHL